jgi:lipoprotein-releasing system permease protein
VNYELKLAAKYFRSRRKSLARFTAIVAVLGIAAGVASLIAAQALARGFQSEMQDKILSNTSHITVYQANGDEIANWQDLKNDLEKIENVRDVLPTSYESALIVNGNVTNYSVLRVFQRKDAKTQSILSSKLETRNEIKISLGKELAEKSDLKIGDEAEIVLPTSRNEFAPKTSKVVISDVFSTGLYDYDSTWIYLSLEDLAKIVQRKDFAPTVLSVSVTDIYRANETAEKLRQILPKDYKIIDWQQANQPLFAALSLERKVALAIILLIIFIAALNITTTLALLINERRLDIAILRTCGAKTKSLVSIFLYEGLFLGVSGIAGGVFFGLLICLLGNYFKIIGLPNEVYALNFVPLKTNASDIFTVVAAAFVLVLLSTVYPAWQAAKIKPLENLQIR